MLLMWNTQKMLRKGANCIQNRKRSLLLQIQHTLYDKKSLHDIIDSHGCPLKASYSCIVTLFSSADGCVSLNSFILSRLSGSWSLTLSSSSSLLSSNDEGVTHASFERPFLRLGRLLIWNSGTCPLHRLPLQLAFLPCLLLRVLILFCSILRWRKVDWPGFRPRLVFVSVPLLEVERCSVALELQDWKPIFRQPVPSVFGDWGVVFRSHHGPTTNYENAVLMQSLASVRLVKKEIYWNEINPPQA